MRQEEFPARLSRRRFLKWFSVGSSTVVLAAGSTSGVSGADKPTATPGLDAASPTRAPGPTAIAVPAAKKGYSIFQGTMVDMPWPEIKQAAEEGAFVLLPIAVIEEHGPHLGLGADVYQTCLWCQLTRQVLETRGVKALIAPSYYWGMNRSTGSFPGSFTVRESTFKAILYDLHDSLRQWGFEYVLSLNLHGDGTHNRVLHYAVQEAREGLGMGAYVVPPPFPPLPQALPVKDVHAGAWETACMGAYFPEDLNRDTAKSLEPSSGFEPWGYFGDPARFDIFDPEDVKKWYETLSVTTADWIMAIVKRHRSG